MRFFTKAIAATVGLLGLIGAGAAQAQTKTVSIAVTLNTDVPQIILALDRGLWKAEGLEVKTVPFATGREAFEALLGGQVEFAALAEFPATIGVLRQQKFAILADMSRYGAQRVIASAKRMPLKSLAELEGKKIGTTLGTNADYLTNVIMAEGGVKSQIVNVAPPDIVPALSRGDIDAAVMFPSFYAQAKKILGDDFREIRTQKYTSHFLLAGTPDMAGPRAAETTAFLRALVKADAIVKAEPAATKEAILRAMKGVMSPDVLDSIFSETDYKLTLDNELIALIQREAAWIIEKGLVKAPEGAAEKQTIRGFIKAELLQSVAKENVTLTP